MQSGLLLLVDADRRAQRGITRVAAEVGVEVVACDSARAGLNAACALEPAAIVTELELPDFDGYWFVAQIRQQPTDVAACPIVVVTHEIDTSSRAGTLKAGADVFLQKPIAPADLVAQTRALVDMVHRLRDRRPMVSGAPGGSLPVLAPAAVAAPHLLPPSGGLDRFPAATVLVALELERRSGRVTLRPPSAVAPPIEIDLASGLILEGRIQGRRLDPLAVVRAALALEDGYFEFVPGADRPALPTSEFTGKLFAMAASEVAPPPRSRRNAPAPAPAPPRTPHAEVVAPSVVDEVLAEKPIPKPAREPTRPPPPKSATSRPTSRPSRSPKAAAKVAPVKLPPARVPAFGPAPPAKPPLAKPPVPEAANLPPRPGVPPAPPPRPAALAHSSALRPGASAARPAAPSPGPDTRRRGAAAAAVRRSVPPPARPDADDDDVIEAENET